MIEVADSNAVYYYHYDALGSVVALSDASGDTVQTYEYSIYGQVAVEDVNHPNPYMFAGRRFDIDIGLYYNRAQYYNPFTGRFLQTDPIGYGDGMNMYAYCRNNSLNYTDPSGLILRDREPDDVITAVILTEHDGHVYGLVGDWDIEDVYGRFNAESQEITTFEIDGMIVYLETNDGCVHLNPYPDNPALVSVWLDATTEAYYRGALDGAEQITAGPDPFDPVDPLGIGIGSGPPSDNIGLNPMFNPSRRFPGQRPFRKPFRPHTYDPLDLIPERTPGQERQRRDMEKEGMGEDATGEPAERLNPFSPGCPIIIIHKILLWHLFPPHIASAGGQQGTWAGWEW